jgi:hypothetical protein
METPDERTALGDDFTQHNVGEDERSEASESTQFGGEPLTTSSDENTDEVEALAATITIQEMERRATDARARGDSDEIQDVQDEYHDQRMSRARRILERKRERENDSTN